MKKVYYSQHALVRMFERDIEPEDVEEALKFGETIQEYPDDQPYSSRLILYKKEHDSIHIVVGDDTENSVFHIITVYKPDAELWDKESRKRRDL